MKKLLFIFITLSLVSGNVFSQSTKAPAKRTTNSVTSKQKAEAEAIEKTKAAEREAFAKAEEERLRISNNSKCRFSFEKGDFVSLQGNEDYVVYEIPNMSASDLKSAVYTALSSMYKSPKDVITSLSDNMIQLEGYAADIYYFTVGSSIYYNDILFNIVIQFKDGKVRYNKPNIKQLYIGGPMGKLKADMSKNISKLIERKDERQRVESYFSSLISKLNSKLKVSNDW